MSLQVAVKCARISCLDLIEIAPRSSSGKQYFYIQTQGHVYSLAVPAVSAWACLNQALCFCSSRKYFLRLLSATAFETSP